MKNSKAILLAIFASAFAVLTVVNMSLASPKTSGENTLDMLEIMTRAFDESEGGIVPGTCPSGKLSLPCFAGCKDSDDPWSFCVMCGSPPLNCPEVPMTFGREGIGDMPGYCPELCSNINPG